MIGYSRTSFFKQCGDSILLLHFSTAFVYALSRTRILVVAANDPSKLPVADDQYFTVNVVQMGLEEYL